MTTKERVTVKVLHNETSRFMPYTTGDSLRETVVFESPFHQLNIDEPQAQWAVEYRERRNRSLSVGDVVTVGERAWAVGPTSWDAVSIEAGQIWKHVGDDVFAQPVKGE